MSELTWCPKCGRDLEAEDYEAGYCSGCGERLESPDAIDEGEDGATIVTGYDPDAAIAAAKAAAAGPAAPSAMEWEIDGEWAICPNCGAAYDIADRPAYCERCGPPAQDMAFLHPDAVPSTHEKVLVLQHLGSGSSVECAGPDTLIGRNVTPCLTGNRYIGREHARIISRNGKYYVYDLGSINGTRLNGRKLKKGTEAELSHGDVLELDIEQFVVQL